MINKRIKKLRKDLDITQEELAKKLNVGQSAINHYESGLRKPDPDMLIKLADFFGVTTDYLLGRADHKQAIILSGESLPEELKGLVDEIEVLKDAMINGLSKEDIQKALKFAKDIKGIK